VDLNTVTDVLRPRTQGAIPAWQPGDAFVAGGTWIFSEPQTGVERLIDLTALGWPALAQTDAGLAIAATCTLSQLEDFEAPDSWRAAPVIGQCCRSLLGSFKIRRVATVGGNLCLALPAAPMAALAVAMHATCTIHNAEGAQRSVPALNFITGASRTVLRPGEYLRAITLAAAPLRRRAAFRQMSLTPLGRSAALLIGTRLPGALELTITGSLPRPVRIALPANAAQADIVEAIDTAVPHWFDDIHGRPDWRRRITQLMAAEIRHELMS
jgi:CO/xanthine dehydrogenase FAD-binding subunit